MYILKAIYGGIIWFSISYMWWLIYMQVDWAALSGIFTGVASLGVVFGAWQIKLSKELAQTQFEDGLDQQYRALSMALPVDVLIGKECPAGKEDNVRELIYNYLDLTNEQAYLRAKGRVSSLTWQSWVSGIKSHLAKPVFANVYSEVRDFSSWGYLNRLTDESFENDPFDWYKF
jgi:hypothetical protein